MLRRNESEMRLSLKMVDHLRLCWAELAGVALVRILSWERYAISRRTFRQTVRY